MPKFTNIRQGQIYWLDDCEPLDGDIEKNRPIIVLDTPENLTSQTHILVVACSTRPNVRDKLKVFVPGRMKDPQTGLSKDCWALPRWRILMNRFRLKVLSGQCPESIVVAIILAVGNQMEIDGTRPRGRRK